MLLIDVFDEIRNSVPMIDVAKFYGLQVSRSGMACCPFHDDKSPSLKIYPDHFYCFGCGETGDGVGFVAKAFGMTQLQAAKKLSYDFGLNLFDGSIATPITMKANPKAEYYAWLRNAQSDVSEYLRKLDYWREKYKPQNPLVPMHSRFIESLTKTSYVEYLNEILSFGTDKEKRELFDESRDKITEIHNRLEKLSNEERVVKRKAI